MACWSPAGTGPNLPRVLPKNAFKKWHAKRSFPNPHFIWISGPTETHMMLDKLLTNWTMFLVWWSCVFVFVCCCLFSVSRVAWKNHMFDDFYPRMSFLCWICLSCALFDCSLPGPAGKNRCNIDASGTCHQKGMPITQETLCSKVAVMLSSALSRNLLMTVWHSIDFCSWPCTQGFLMQKTKEPYIYKKLGHPSRKNIRGKIHWKCPWYHCFAFSWRLINCS